MRIASEDDKRYRLVAKKWYCASYLFWGEIENHIVGEYTFVGNELAGFDSGANIRPLWQDFSRVVPTVSRFVEEMELCG